MPQNNKNCMKRNSTRNIEPKRCICNCDSDSRHNYNNSDGCCTAKSPIKTSKSEAINKQGSNSNKIATESSLEHRKSTAPPIIHRSPVVILNNIGKTDRFKITRLGSTYEAKAAGSPGQIQNHKTMKHCYVLLRPLPQTMLKQNQAGEKTEITNKPKPTVKMKTLSSTAVLRKPTTSEQSISRIDGAAANQPNHLNHNIPINSTALSDKMKDKKNIEEQVVKKPLVDGTNLNKSSALKFRKRKIINYAESSLETSRDLQKDVITNTNKIPVYKQHMENKIESKKQGDTYEFDSDSEQRKKRKRRKLHNSSSDEYNKTIENILKNVATKIKRKRRKNVIHNYKNNNNHKAKQIKPLIIPTKQENIVPNKCIINVTSELKNNEVEKNITSEMAVETYQLEKFPKGNIERQEDSDGYDNDDFDFGYDDAEANKENSPRIKIISDIRLIPNKELSLSVGTPRKFREVRPNAHSTMLNNVLTPWRFNDINIIRNPHFITLKESSLPCINQEMVLDHTMVDKFADNSRSESAKTPRRIADDQQNPKKMIQSIVTDFFENYTENKENENAQSSLFDSEQFSPIKNKNQFNKVDSVKRRILGDLNDNTGNVYASTPKPNVTNLRVPEVKNVNNTPENSPLRSNMKDGQKKKKPDKDFTNFGFSSSDEENDDQISPTKCRDDKPFRLNVNVNDKKYHVNQKFKKSEKAETVILSDAENEMSEQSDVESHSGEGKLFEDITLTRYEDRRLEPQVKKKMKKLKWMNDNHTDIQKHKRRKDVRSKEEEEDAEKWAVAFNSMCKEIEDFPLEIE